MTSSRPRATIYVNGRFLSRPVTGVERYAREMLGALDKLLTAGIFESLPVAVLVPPNEFQAPGWNTLRIRKVGRLEGHLWEQFELPFHARHGLLFTPCGAAPVAHSHNVVVIHDAAPFRAAGAYTAVYRNYYKTLHSLLARTAMHILTDSEFSRQELRECLRIPGDRISYSWLSGEHILRYELNESALSKYQLSSKQYVLAVGSKNPNKNLHTLVRAFSQLPASDLCLAIAGGSNSSVFAPSHALAGRVRELGYVPDEDLRTLYHHAACFVFPSIYEGFGLPPLEALTVGCPVIVSRAASLPEVFGDAAVYCDPHSHEDIAQRISQVMQGDHPSAEAMRERAGQFTWERCARETFLVLRNLMPDKES